MEKTLKNRQNKGITLIALVITIIVMLILVAVTIAMAVDGGLFGKATIAGIKTNQAVLAEKDLGNGKIKIKEGTKIYEYATIDDYFTNTPSKVYEDGEVEEETPETPETPENPGDGICTDCKGTGYLPYDYWICEGCESVCTENKKAVYFVKIYCDCFENDDRSEIQFVDSYEDLEEKAQAIDKCPSCGTTSISKSYGAAYVCPYWDECRTLLDGGIDWKYNCFSCDGTGSILP